MVWIHQCIQNVATFEVRYNLRQPDWIVDASEFGRVKIGEGYQHRGLIVGGDDNRGWVGFGGWLWWWG
jgi:hypothetical protein